MEQLTQRIVLASVPFKSASPGSYTKQFGKEKDALRAEGFPLEKTKDFVASNITEKSIKKINKHIDTNTFLLSMPIKKGNSSNNIIPKLYASELSKQTGNPHIDLSDYLVVRQHTTARSAYNTTNRANNHFNIAYISKEKGAELKALLYNKSALLVDDVLTTGETMVTMATFLKSEIKDLDIKGANALVAVSNRTPTQTDMERINEKFAPLLPKEMNVMEIRSTIQESFENFTRKKMMRVEVNLKSPEAALSQYDTMIQDNEKIQDSLKESIAANLFRFPLDKDELLKLSTTKAENLSDNFSLRALLHHYPKAIFTEDKAGMVRLFSDQSMDNQLSLSKNPNINQQSAITDAMKYIQSSPKELSQKQENKQSRNL